MPQDSQSPRKDETQCWTSPHDLTTFAWPTFFWVSYFSSKCVIRFYFVYKLDVKLAPNSYYTFPSSSITKNFFRGFKVMKLCNLFLCFFFWYVFKLSSLLYFYYSRRIFRNQSNIYVFFAKKLHHRCLAVLQIRLCTLRLFIPSKQKWNDFLFAKHSILAKINNKFWKFVEIGIWKYDDINIYYSIETFFFNILRRDQVLFSS